MEQFHTIPSSMEQFRTIPSSIYLFYFYFIFIFIFFYFLPHFFLFLTHFWTIRPSHHSMEQFRTIPSSLYLQTKSETSCQNTFPVDAHRRHPRVRYVVCDTKCAICRVRFVVCDMSCFPLLEGKENSFSNLHRRP